ncbi:MAG TPA: ABC transporter ATP-binding protein [Verrucomicrobiae bacterium]|nr:ABC transporter ATP-binding protein [Verrucomicrobiae bacterium]
MPTTRSKQAIRIDKVSIVYGQNTAVDNVSFSVRTGSVHALIGPNGSGKSSIIHAVMGINPLHAGQIEVAGTSVYGDGTSLAALRREFGIVPDEDDLIEPLTGHEYARLSAALYGLDSDQAHARIQELGELFELKALDDRIGSYSHGMRKKLAFIAAMVAKPALYIIDEPTNGLDPDMILLIKEIILSLKRNGKSVLLATHNLDFAQDIADDITMIRSKRIASGSVKEVLQKAKAKTLEEAYLKLSGGQKKHEAIESYIVD